MIEDKIKTGYAYTIDSGKPVNPEERSLIVQTGSGGALEYIKSCRELGMPEEMIGDDIFIHMDEGVYPVKLVHWTSDNQN